MNTSSLIICIDAAEARLMRKLGYKCVTSVKVRQQLKRILLSRAPNAVQLACDALRAFGGISDADNPKRWSLWFHSIIADIDTRVLQAALDALPKVPTPLRDPEDYAKLRRGEIHECEGTTVLVAFDTFQLVQVADLYANREDCYRPHGRMDEPFIPEPGRVCLATKDELRLIRIDGLEDVTVVLTYDPDSQKPQGMTGLEVTPHTSHASEVSCLPSCLRALCAERPDLRVRVATAMNPPRRGDPFFLGMCRGLGYETDARTDAGSDASLDFSIETNTRPVSHTFRMVIWEGGDDVRQLARFGGLSIFIGGGLRRKVQLRSLGLSRSGTVAGQPVYDMDDNLATLRAWSVKREFDQPATDMRHRNQRRVRCGKPRDPNTPGGRIYNTSSPRCIRVTLENRQRTAAKKMRNTLIASSSEGGGVTTVPLKTLGEGKSYYLNGRATDTAEGVVIDKKRSKIRCPQWRAADAAGLLAWLQASPYAVACGMTPDGKVWGIARIANGTEDQQAEAAWRWAEGIGRQFPRAAGDNSLELDSLDLAAVVRVGSVHHTNWRAEALRTDCYERYRTAGDYGAPLKIERRGTASASERARAYADKVPLADEGTRNSNLSTAVFKMVEHFGKEATADALPYLLAKSTLPEKEKRKTALRILHRPERKQS